MARNLSFLRNNVEKHPSSRGDPGVQPTAVQESSTGPWLSTVYGVGQWFTVLFAHQLQKLVRAKSGFWSNLDQVCGEGLGMFYSGQPLAIMWFSTCPKSIRSQMQPTGPDSSTDTTAGSYPLGRCAGNKGQLLGDGGAHSHSVLPVFFHWWICLWQC